jgi:hypothetical protein
MSLDHFIWVPTGARNDENLRYQHYYRYAELAARHNGSRHQVFLVHGAPCLIDEQYFFEDPADAQWFWDKGYQERLYLVDEGSGSYGYDRMSLWIADKEVASRGSDG